MIYGYLTEGLTDKDSSVQLNSLKEAGAECIYREENFYQKDRPQFDVIVKRIRYRDTFIIWKLSRIGYSFKNMTYKVRSLLEPGFILNLLKKISIFLQDRVNLC